MTVRICLGCFYITGSSRKSSTMLSKPPTTFILDKLFRNSRFFIEVQARKVGNYPKGLWLYSLKEKKLNFVVAFFNMTSKVHKKVQKKVPNEAGPEVVHNFRYIKFLVQFCIKLWSAYSKLKKMTIRKLVYDFRSFISFNR